LISVFCPTSGITALVSPDDICESRLWIRLIARSFLMEEEGSILSWMRTESNDNWWKRVSRLDCKIWGQNSDPDSRANNCRSISEMEFMPLKTAGEQWIAGKVSENDIISVEWVNEKCDSVLWERELLQSFGNDSFVRNEIQDNQIWDTEWLAVSTFLPTSFHHCCCRNPRSWFWNSQSLKEEMSQYRFPIQAWLCSIQCWIWGFEQSFWNDDAC
jgi:hypothetical protein